jgi:hypothetical protein
MIERNKTPRQRAKPKSSTLPLLQSVFAVIGVISIIFICMIATLLAISPSSLQDVIGQLYPIDTQEPQFVIITATQPLPTSTPTLPLVTSTPELLPPSGEWAVRAYDTDDTNILVVNGHIVGVSTYEGDSKDSGWININLFLKSGDANYVTFVNVNGPRKGIWGFALQHDGTTVWGNEGTTEQANTIGYYRTIQIFSNNNVMELSPNELQDEHLEGQWGARVVAKDVGLILINGIPVAAGYDGFNFGWFDATNALFTGVDNEVTAIVWNSIGEYSWDLAIRFNETIIWGSDDQGIERVGEVYQTSFIIDANGNVIP